MKTKVNVEPAAAGDLTREEIAVLVQICDAYRDLARSAARSSWSVHSDALVRGVRDKLRARL
jgi:hypothetical protein